MVNLDEENLPKNITQAQVEALSWLAQHLLQDEIQVFLEQQAQTEVEGYYLRRDCTARITYTVYGEVFEKLKLVKSEQDPDWAHAELP